MDKKVGNKTGTLVSYIFVVSLFLQFPCLSSAPIPDNDDSILYKCNHSVILFSKDKKPLSKNSTPKLFLLVSEGTGYLANFDAVKCNRRGIPRATHNIRASLQQHRAWTKLNILKLKELWGEPHNRKTQPIGLLSFDVYGKWNDENNLYHLDVNLDKKGNPCSYRVRGIGISNPLWIQHKQNDSFGTYP